MIEDRNIICLASNWFYDPTSKHHVMKLLSQRNHILWVNYHGSRRPGLNGGDLGAMAGKLRQIIQGPRRVEENITVVTPLVVPLPGNKTIEALNRGLLVRQIGNLLRDLPDRPTQLWTFAPDVDYLCGRFDEECVVYYCVDEFSEFTGYEAKSILAAERRLAARADLVITTSQALYAAKAPLNRNVSLVTHGVDCEHFAAATHAATVVPAEIAGLPRPILGFWGLIQDWVDVGLIAEVARKRPEWSIVLIGDQQTPADCLHNLPNVHLLGRRPYGELPLYAKGFDIALIPFRLNTLTRAVNPIKLREYLSAGLPVVSTALPEVERYGDLVQTAADTEAFINACSRAWEQRRAEGLPGIERRCAAMRRETWTAKVEEISQRVQECLYSRQGISLS